MSPHTAYQTDPIGWARDKLGISEATIRWSLNEAYGAHKWDGDVDPLVLIADALVNWQSVGAESGTGTGKSFWIAVIILWFQACFENSQVFTFAPKAEQLKLFIWKNITEMWPRFKRHFPTAELTDLTIRMRGGINDTWAAHGYPVGLKAGEAVSTKAAGMHAEHLLLVYEEMAAIAPQVVAAGKNTCVSPHNLRIGIGNPNSQLDTLHKFCHEAGVVHVRISALDHPNVVTGDDSLIPGAVGRQSIEDRRRDYTESSPIYQSRVRGVSPEQASNSLFKLEWFNRSVERYNERKAKGTLPTKVTGKGVDAANSEHGDHAAICDFADNVMIRLEDFPCPNANGLGRQVGLEIGGYGDEPVIVPANLVGVDGIGVGSGTVNTLRDTGRIVQAIMFGFPAMKGVDKNADGSPREYGADVNEFLNVRAQVYWQARMDFLEDVIDVPEDPELFEDLLAVTFDDTNKVVKLAPKDEIKALLGRSPNRGDAFVIANWVRKRAAVVPRRPPYEKIDNRASPIHIVNGVLMPAPSREPKSAADYEEWFSGRTGNDPIVGGRSGPHRVRLPRRRYS